MRIAFLAIAATFLLTACQTIQEPVPPLNVAKGQGVASVKL